MTGISISFNGIYDEAAMEEFLPALRQAKDLGAESIEIRNVRPEYDPKEVAKAVCFFTGRCFAEISSRGIVRTRLN